MGIDAPRSNKMEKITRLLVFIFIVRSHARIRINPGCIILFADSACLAAVQKTFAEEVT
jgi:hypothetical protein